MEVLRRSSVFAAEVMEVFDRSPTDKELVSQAKVLCRDYIHSRLLRAGIGWSKPEHSAPMPGGRLAEVSSVLLRLGDELEYIRPNIYRNIARQLNISLHSETVVTDAFLAVAAQIFTAGTDVCLGCVGNKLKYKLCYLAFSLLRKQSRSGTTALLKCPLSVPSCWAVFLSFYPFSSLTPFLFLPRPLVQH
uniref:BCL2 family apoptosis regulator BOK n=1 Tax=Gopherus agassizii TaxID=38772 RepID=A0A452GV90_9SAUR